MNEIIGKFQNLKLLGIVINKNYDFENSNEVNEKIRSQIIFLNVYILEEIKNLNQKIQKNLINFNNFKYLNEILLKKFYRYQKELLDIDLNQFNKLEKLYLWFDCEY